MEGNEFFSALSSRWTESPSEDTSSDERDDPHSFPTQQGATTPRAHAPRPGEPHPPDSLSPGSRQGAPQRRCLDPDSNVNVGGGGGGGGGGADANAAGNPPPGRHQHVPLSCHRL